MAKNTKIIKEIQQDFSNNHEKSPNKHIQRTTKSGVPRLSAFLLPLM